MKVQLDEDELLQDTLFCASKLAGSHRGLSNAVPRRGRLRGRSSEGVRAHICGAFEKQEFPLVGGYTHGAQ